MCANWKLFAKSAFTLVEVVFAVAIISVTLIGVSSIISFWGRQAIRIEDEREIADLTLSVKTCVKELGVAALRSVPSGESVPVHFGADNAQCLTWSSFTGSYNGDSVPKIRLKTVAWSGSESEETEREYGAYFTVSTTGVPSSSASVTLNVTNGTITKTLAFRSDESF